MALRTASIALAFFLVPAAAWAASEDPCTRAEDVPPVLHPTSSPLARDGWIAFDLGYEGGSFSDVRLRDGTGREITTTAVFGDRTRRRHEIFDPAEEVLEPGSYELVFMFYPECFEPREVTLPLEVVDRFAEPAVAPPVINAVHAELWDGSSLSIDVDVEYPAEEDPPTWLLVDADFPDPVNWEIDSLFAPRGWDYIEFYRSVEDQDVSEVCVRATFYDAGGTPSETTELCTTDIEHRSADDSGLCRVGGGGSPAWALGVLLGVGLIRRRRGRNVG